MTTMRRTLKFTLGALCAAAALGAQALELEPSARLHFDYATHDADRTALPDRLLVRRASFGLEGKFDADWSFEAGYDLAGVYEVTQHGAHRDGVFKDGVKDLRLQYEGWKLADLNFGQFKVPFGLEELTSSNNLVFIERALPSDAFAPSRRLGLGLAHQRERYTLAAMAFGSSVDGGSRGRGVAARATYAPILAGDTVLHLGAALAVERPRGEFKFNARPESKASDERFVSTGDLDGVRRIDRIGLEAAWKSGPLWLQAEWMQAALRREQGLPQVRLSGWSIGGAWLLTGESRAYRKGVFRGVPVSRPGGAWELTARASRIDLDGHDVRGGRERNLTLGVNYYLNENVRFMANWIRVHSTRRGRADDPRILLLRAQFAF